jgi:hypothetical protein
MSADEWPFYNIDVRAFQVDANSNFYADLAEDCCNALEHVEVPVFQVPCARGNF